MPDILDLEALRATPLKREPFDYLIVPGFVTATGCAAANRDYPDLTQPGSFPAQFLRYGAGFQQLLDALQGDAFEDAVADKFGVALEGLPTITTVRAQCRLRDGKIHTDSASKLITILIYLNSDWEAAGGRLRVLRGPSDMLDYADEVPPVAGTLLAFRRNDHSWHGHEAFEGPRRVLQFNWVTEQRWVDREIRRHRLSQLTKWMHPFG
ncbi:2OG-Fe(II) oxygenase [Zavarzinia sp. CC-PAN008]|uniref:2OG-Fe(II) oxygenase family protein n=1 Tax=Zavarzinia sp. CC-PAN008 TaxID=3243332 RepID=UPI003F748775